MPTTANGVPGPEEASAEVREEVSKAVATGQCKGRVGWAETGNHRMEIIPPDCKEMSTGASEGLTQGTPIFVLFHWGSIAFILLLVGEGSVFKFKYIAEVLG